MLLEASLKTEVPIIGCENLFLLDGIITDFEETKRAIITASDLPLSIIIVGNIRRGIQYDRNIF